MRALLDVNFMIALLDPDHVFHERAHEWWEANFRGGWASCPLTENGVVRIMSHSSYSRKTQFTPSELIDRLRQFATQTDHEFWPDEISVRDEQIFDVERLHSSLLLTDTYLLALATKRSGQLVTFDQGIVLSAVKAARPANLNVV